MYQKKFVSIYFSSSNIQVVKLNAKKTAVVKHASFALPEGIIVSHRVQDPKALSEVIKKIWEQMKIRERAVGVVVPEFSTFTKTLVLPALVDRELDEAVRWQASEQLPFEKNSAILDWKIIEDKESEKTVLVSAISNEVLTGYVDAISGAGLYPLSVETPAISLVRIISKEKKKRLIVYKGASETILLITNGQSITGSSVIGTSDEQATLSTAMQIIYHYAQGSIEEIYVGGIGFTKDFYAQLHQNFSGAEPQQISQPIQGITPQELQEYMIPISLQMQEPQAPEDEHTINLLPPSWVKHYEDQLLTKQAWNLSLVSAVVVWLCVATSLFAYALINTEQNSLSQKTSEKTPQVESITASIEETNKIIANLSGIAAYDMYPQTYINAINSAKPEAITIAKYSVNLESGTASIVGFAPTRQDVINFKDNLEKGGQFALVNIPISSLLEEENVEFSVELKKEVQQPKAVVPKLKL